MMRQTRQSYRKIKRISSLKEEWVLLQGEGNVIARSFLQGSDAAIPGFGEVPSPETATVAIAPSQ
jgi:hypothetical protein